MNMLLYVYLSESEYLFVLFQSAKVMEEGYIYVDNSGLLQKVKKKKKTHNVA